MSRFVGICCLGLVFSTLSTGCSLAQNSPFIEVEFTNPQLIPPHWLMKLNPDGSGRFDSDFAKSPDPAQAKTPEVHRTIQLSTTFADRVFATARSHKIFAIACESNLKVAFQGKKRLTYSGPEGTGSCTYNYSKDKEIQSIGDALVGVSATIQYGARLEFLLQHDRLGLDKEMGDLAAAQHDGNALEMGSIREILERLANDDQVLDRVRKRARLLLATAH